MSNDGKLSFIVDLKQRIDADLEKMRKSVGDTKAAFQSSMSGIKSSIAAAFSVAAIAGFARSIVDYASKIKDASSATGLSTTNFQALAITAKQNGVDMDSLTMALGRLRDVQGSVGNDERIQKNLARIGITAAEAAAAEPDALLQRIASGIRATGDASVAFDIFGRNAAKLISTLEELADGWDSLVAKTRMGIIDQTDIENIDRLGDTMDNAAVTAKSWGAALAGAWDFLAGVAGKVAGGEGLMQAGQSVMADRAADKKAAEERKAKAQALKNEMAQRDKDERDKKDLAKEEETGGKLGDQYAKATYSSKDYEARLQERVNRLAADANEQGLSALERQRRHNAALEATLELLEAQKKLKDEADQQADKDKRKADKDKRKADKDAETDKGTDEKIRDYKMSKLAPEKQVEVINKDIERNRKELNAGQLTPERRRELVDKQVELSDKRDKLKEDMATSEKKRSKKVSDANENISDARRTKIGGAGIGDVFGRRSDLRGGRTPMDDAALQTAENTRVIAENIKLLKELGNPS